MSERLEASEDEGSQLNQRDHRLRGGRHCCDRRHRRRNTELPARLLLFLRLSPTAATSSASVARRHRSRRSSAVLQRCAVQRTVRPKQTTQSATKTNSDARPNANFVLQLDQCRRETQKSLLVATEQAIEFAVPAVAAGGLIEPNDVN